MRLHHAEPVAPIGTLTYTACPQRRQHPTPWLRRRTRLASFSRSRRHATRLFSCWLRRSAATLAGHALERRPGDDRQGQCRQVVRIHLRHQTGRCGRMFLASCRTFRTRRWLPAHHPYRIAIRQTDFSLSQRPDDLLRRVSPPDHSRPPCLLSHHSQILTFGPVSFQGVTSLGGTIVEFVLDEPLVGRPGLDRGA
jgi:hypothetical protein